MRKKSMKTTSYSMWRTFKNCRQACAWRYVHGLVPVERDPNLAFGALIHQCLEAWYVSRDLDIVLNTINRHYPERRHDMTQKRAWQLATAMMRGYIERYPTEDFDIVALEEAFEGDIINPSTGAHSRKFTLAGRVDGIVKRDGDYYLLEHKTASVVDSRYIQRLWWDFQITLYSFYITHTQGIPISSVIYNVLVKTKLKQKNAESDDEFEARLAEKYREPEMFHRFEITFSAAQYRLFMKDLWEITQQFLDAKRRGIFYQNTEHCFQYGRSCPYLPLCRAHGDLEQVPNLYVRHPSHEECVENHNSASGTQKA